MALTIVAVLTLCALTLLATGFVACFGDQMRSPGCYFTWAVVVALVICVLIDTPLWALIGNFIILLFTAWLWLHDLKERA